MRLSYISATAILGLLVLVGGNGCGPTTDGGNARETTYSRVIKSETIRVAWVPAPPAVIVDPNTAEKSGIFVEALERAAKNLGLKVQWVEEVGWGTMIEGLKADRYDVVCTQVWPNASRAKHADFSTPLYYVPIGIYCRVDDDRFVKTLDALNSPDVKISTIDGEMSDVIAKQRFPKAASVSLPQMSDVSQMLQQVAQGKADVTFAMLHDGASFAKANPGKVRNIAVSNPIQYFPNSYMFRQNQSEFKAMIDTALQELINQGFVDDVIKKHEQFPNTIYRVRFPFEAPK